MYGYQRPPWWAIAVLLAVLAVPLSTIVGLVAIWILSRIDTPRKLPL
jgi:ABC-type sulfate transport system permease subunit